MTSPAVRRGCLTVLLAGAMVAAVGCVSAPAMDEAFDVDVPEDFLLARDFPDPDLLEVADGWLAFATQSDSANVQVARSADLASWTLLDRDAFPEPAPWVREGDTWAPDVAAWDGGFLLFHTSTDERTGVQCIGVARAVDPLGPFEETAEAPLVCPEDGAIDPSFVVDDGLPYLVWKEDGNCCGGTGRIFLTPLSRDGLRVAGDSVVLLETSRLWEGDVVEAPTLIRRSDEYVLFYSGGDYYTLDYGIGWARSESLTGPYAAAKDPLVTTESSDFAFIGPGGQDVVGDVLFFHSWDAQHSYRGMHSAPLRWIDGAPQIVLPREPD